MCAVYTAKCFCAVGTHPLIEGLYLADVWMIETSESRITNICMIPTNLLGVEWDLNVRIERDLISGAKESRPLLTRQVDKSCSDFGWDIYDTGTGTGKIWPKTGWLQLWFPSVGLLSQPEPAKETTKCGSKPASLKCQDEGVRCPTHGEGACLSWTTFWHSSFCYSVMRKKD